MVVEYLIKANLHFPKSIAGGPLEESAVPVLLGSLGSLGSSRFFSVLLGHSLPFRPQMVSLLYLFLIHLNHFQFTQKHARK